MLAVGAVPFVYSMVRRSRATAEWRAVLERVASALGGQVGNGEDPVLRAVLDDVQVVVRVRGLPNASRTILSADAILPATAPSARLYVGWGVQAPPAELAHIPEVHTELRRLLDRRVYVRGDWASLAEQFAREQADALTELQRAVPARAIEILYRGGHVHLAVHGSPPESSAVIALVRETARLRHATTSSSARDSAFREAPPAGTAPTAPTARASPLATDTRPTTAADTRPPHAADTRPSPPAGAPRPATPGALRGAEAGRRAPARRSSTPPLRPRPDVHCFLCQEHAPTSADRHWSRCLRCDTPYHTRCWSIATGCLAPGCVETRALPL